MFISTIDRIAVVATPETLPANTYAAPLAVGAIGAPTITSPNPSPLTSPQLVTALPKRSPAASPSSRATIAGLIPSRPP